MLILEASAGEIIYVQMDGVLVVCPRRFQEYGRNVRGYKVSSAIRLSLSKDKCSILFKCKTAIKSELK